MRLIDADRLKAHYAWWGEDSDKKRTFDTIVDLQPTAGPEWIQCAERLPDHEAICCDNRGNMLIGYVEPNEGSETGFCAESDECFMYDCIAWMPLPEQYKEGE